MSTSLSSPVGETFSRTPRPQYRRHLSSPRQVRAGFGTGASFAPRHDPVPQISGRPVLFRNEARPWRLIPLALLAVFAMTSFVAGANALFTQINGDTQPLRVIAAATVDFVTSLT